MKYRRWGKGIGVAAAVVLTVLSGVAFAPRTTGAAEDGSPIRIGLIRSLFRDTSEPLMQIVMRPFKALMKTQTGISGELVAAGESKNLAERLKSGDCQLGIFHGFEFAWARQAMPELGVRLRVHDPEAIANVKALYGDKLVYCDRPYGTLEGANGLAIITEWQEFRNPDFEMMRRLLVERVIFDGRNLYDPKTPAGYGFTYYSIGRQTARGEPEA